MHRNSSPRPGHISRLRSHVCRCYDSQSIPGGLSLTRWLLQCSYHKSGKIALSVSGKFTVDQRIRTLHSTQDMKPMPPMAPTGPVRSTHTFHHPAHKRIASQHLATWTQKPDGGLYGQTRGTCLSLLSSSQHGWAPLQQVPDRSAVRC